jgi:hypothetical protein
MSSIKEPVPSICGSFLTSKRALLAFSWTVATVLTLVAFMTATVLTIRETTHYRHLERANAENNYNNYNEDQNNDQQSHDDGEEDRQQDASQIYALLSSTSSGAVTFCALYTVTLALAISLYGSTAIVGFMSLKGDYIAPCFPSDRMRVGIFGGALVVFANLLMVLGVVLGEFRVS